MATQAKLSLEEIDVNKLAARVRGMSDQEKREFILSLPQRKHVIAEKSKRVQGRLSTPDELWNWIKEETGLEIPRISVCDGHCAPFDFVWDAYSNKERALLLLASREGGKTIGVAVVHYANAETKPGCEGCTFGAILPQAKRAYGHIKGFIFTTDADGNRIPKPQISGEPTRSETLWKSGSKIEIIVGTESGVNSPHPQVVHADEIDLMEDAVFAESRNMAGSKKLKNGDRISAQDIATSTRKSNKGLMQKIIDEVEDAEAKGNKPPWKLYIYCVAEVAEEVPCCRAADPVQRVRRLVELGKDPAELCECNKVVKGEWAENNPRTLNSVCKGRFFRSRGWLPYEDIVGKFMQNTQAVWEAQMECSRPSADGLYLPSFTRERFCLRQWIPRPEYGRLWMGIDWGGSAASAILWIQGPLYQPIQIMGYNHADIVVPQGAYVVFDEIHQANVGATKLAEQVVTREIEWRQHFPGWKVSGRFADMAGKQQRDDWREHNPPLWTAWHIDREFQPTVDCIQGLVSDARWFVDITRCPNVVDDAESWRQKKGKEVEDEATHCLIAGSMVATTQGDVPIESIQEGDEVHTRKGPRRVVWSGVSGDRPQPLIRVGFSNGAELVGTHDHPVWVEDRGFVHMAALRYGDIVTTWPLREKPSSIEELPTIDIQKQRNLVIEGITREDQEDVNIFIDRFGKIFMDLFQMAITSIMMMGISTTTIQQISYVELPRSICKSILGELREYLRSNIVKRLRRGCRSLSFGTLRRVTRQEKEPGNMLCSIGRFSTRFVTVAKNLSNLRLGVQDFVQTIVSQNGVENRRWITRREYASHAGIHFQPISMETSERVLVYVVSVSDEIDKQWVYDLTVDDAHEFYANGILTHNSMASNRYALANVEVLERRQGNRGKSEMPVAVARSADTQSGVPGAGPVVSGDGYESERWREGIGAGNFASGADGWRV